MLAVLRHGLGRLAPALALATLLTGGATADGATPIQITLLGPGPVRVRVTRGTTFPCDSSDNRRLIEQRLEPGQTVRASVPEHCVCLQQTYAPFIDVDWSQSSLVCRPQLCRGVGRARRCIPAPDPTIRLELRSLRPTPPPLPTRPPPRIFK